MHIARGAARSASASRANDRRSASRAAPQARASSITRRNADIVARGSRQARRPVSMSAAGVVAASMARRCQITI
jgi:hypothetical protein